MNIDYEKMMKTVKEHLWGPTGSVLLHVIVIGILLNLTIAHQEGKTADTEVIMMEPDAQKLDQIQEEIQKLEEKPEVVEQVEVPDNVNISAEPPPDMAGATAGPGFGSSTDANTDLNALDVNSDVMSPLVMKGLYAGRSAGGRSAGLRGYAGRWGGFTEAAVLRALEWLKNHQEKDGSWAMNANKAAMTGLGLLTFLAHGETTSSPKYGATVENAIKYLMDTQHSSGEFASINQAGVYAHAIAAYAVCEAYGLTKIPKLKDSMEKAVTVILKGQQPGGGWDYGYKKTERRDTSVLGWQVQALKAAYIAGAEVPGIKEALEKAVNDLKAAYSAENGKFGYEKKGSGSAGCTAIGVLCMELLGHAMEKETRGGIEALKDENVVWTEGPGFALYGWYYITQAKFHQGGQTWSSWNEKFAKEFVKRQNADGSWTPPEKEKGQGLVYGTTFAALTLQVYYRMLPTYKPIAVQPATTTSGDGSDVKVQIL